LTDTLEDLQANKQKILEEHREAMKQMEEKSMFS